MPVATWDSPTATWDDPVATWDSGFRPPIPPRRRRVEVTWTIDGKDVKVSNATRSAAEGGYDTASMDVPEGTKIEQGSGVEAHVNGERVWYGKVDAPPLVVRGKATIRATGPKAQAEQRKGPLWYQRWGAEPFDDTDAEPYERGQSGLIDVTVRRSLIRFKIEKDTSLIAGRHHSASMWAEGSPGGLRRIAGRVISESAFTQGMVLRVRRFTGPRGSFQNVPPPISAQGVFDYLIANPEDGLDLSYENASGDFTATGTKVAKVVNLRVNGRFLGDEHSTGAVVEDVGNQLGWDTSGVTLAGINAMPYVHEGGPWTEVLDYMEMLQDWFWRVTGPRGSGPYLEFAPWGRKVWTVTLEGGRGAPLARPELDPLPIYNVVTVRFTRPNGAQGGFTLRADPDPLEGKGDQVWEEELGDPQPDLPPLKHLAEKVAENLGPRVFSQQWSGRLAVASARDDAGREGKDHMLPGDHIRIADAGPLQGLELPVTDVEWPQGEPAMVGVNQEATAARIIAKAEVRHARKKWRRKGKR